MRLRRSSKNSDESLLAYSNPAMPSRASDRTCSGHGADVPEARPFQELFAAQAKAYGYTPGRFPMDVPG